MKLGAGESGRLSSLLKLFVGKVSPIFVALFFIPKFNAIFGAHDFGVVATIFSLQALLIVLDLGFSIMVLREMSGGESDEKNVSILCVSEKILASIYGIAFLVSGSYLALRSDNIGRDGVFLLCIPLFGCLVLQNLYYHALLGKQKYSLVSNIQIGFIFLRALASYLAIRYVAATLYMFIVAQLIVSVIHYWVTRKLVVELGGSGVRSSKISLHFLKSLLKKSIPIMGMSIFGAMAVQLDKSIIAYYRGPEVLSPYYLASIFCSIPISVFAGPIYQFFQPKVVYAAGDSTSEKDIYRKFLIALLSVVVFPSAVAWYFSPHLIGVWLVNAKPDQVVKVVEYSRILLVAYSVGAIGFFPYSLLLAARDYVFQFKIAFLSASFVLISVAIIAANQNLSINWICLIYLAYHAATVILPWRRAYALKILKGNESSQLV